MNLWRTPGQQKKIHFPLVSLLFLLLVVKIFCDRVYAISSFYFKSRKNIFWKILNSTYWWKILWKRRWSILDVKCRNKYSFRKNIISLRFASMLSLDQGVDPFPNCTHSVIIWPFIMWVYSPLRRMSNTPCIHQQQPLVYKMFQGGVLFSLLEIYVYVICLCLFYSNVW